jgi:hypothetical protein
MKTFFNYGLMLVATSGLLFLNSCGTDPEPPDATLPEPDGTVQISFLNYPGSGDITTTAAPGDVVAVAVQVQKTSGGNRPQKLRVWETNVLNTRGTQFGSTIDLRNTDDPQIKNINYTVPQSASGTIYLYFEVDESDGKFSRKVLTITSGSAGISSYTGVVLGAQSNDAGSRVASATGQVYKACDAAVNISDIDITYASIGSPVAKPTLVSNPGRTAFNLSTNATNCGDNAPSSTAGGPATVFAKATGFDFAGVTDAILDATTVESTSQSIEVQAGDIIAFKRLDGKKGVIKVNSFPDGTGTVGSISIDIKVQK